MGIPNLHEKPSERPFSGKPLSWVQQNPRIFQMYHGTVGWQWDIDCANLVGKALYKFFMTRDPIEFLKSAVTHDDALFDMVEAKIGTKYVREDDDEVGRRLTRAVNYWLGYVETFSKGREHLFVEEFRPGGRSLVRFCETVGYPREIMALAETKADNVNTRSGSEGYLEDALLILNKRHPDLFETLLQAREDIGYED